MGIRKYNPTTPGLRGMTVSTFEEITTSTPEKSLTVTLKKHAGRNNRGKITVRHQRWRHKTEIQNHRLQENERRYSGNSKDDRIRSEQKRKHRTSCICRRRKEIHSRS